MKNRNFLVIFLIICITTFMFSCEKFITLEPPKNSLVPATVFKNDDLATAAVLGIYQQMASSGYASGDLKSISTICGLTADEFIGYDPSSQPFFKNLVLGDNLTVLQIWSSLYKRIYDTNAILQGLGEGTGVTPAVAAGLRGEALFIRAFNYYYLCNLFGPVPLQLTTDYQRNSKAKRTPVNEIYAQIILDLKAAEELLTDQYITTERVRPNKSAVQALLARVYLFIGGWENAEKYAASVISKTGTYQLSALEEVFLKNSTESIWQLMPPANANTPAGSFLILTTAPTFVSLSPDFAQSGFESNDKRKDAWVKSLVSNDITYYYPFKYRVQNSPDVSEYTMVLRLGEQYLIRAEARAQLNNLQAAVADLDHIRARAGLPLIKDAHPLINKEDLLDLVQKERRAELFTEWGDRWFYLKRTDKLTSVLQPFKPGWKAHYALLPIPVAEINANTNISQNTGY